MGREKILRRIKVELGKTDAEMEHDPALSVANLMRFDRDAEDNGEFDLVMQQVRGGEGVVWVFWARRVQYTGTKTHAYFVYHIFA